MSRSFIISFFIVSCILALTSADCLPACSGSTPICGAGDVCVACTAQSQCWAISNNELSCDLSTGACTTCTSSATCPEAAPICSSVTSTCAACNATAECSARLSGSVCDTNLGTCNWCNNDTECGSYGAGATCSSITGSIRKCTVAVVPPVAAPGAPDPNNINGVITAYVIICIVLLMLFIMFIVCACTRDEDYAPSNTPVDKSSATKKPTPKPFQNGKTNGSNGTNGSDEIELEDKPKKKTKAN